MSLIQFRPLGSPSFDVAVPQGQPTVETPFQEIDRSHVIVTQRYMQQVEAYKSPSENQRMPKEILPSLNVLAYHCYDGPRTPINGTPIIQFDRVWATVPKSFYDPQTFTVPGRQPSGVGLYAQSQYFSTYNVVDSYINLGITSVGANINLSAKTKRDFFLIGTNGQYSYQTVIPTKNEELKSYYDWSQILVGQLTESSVFMSAISRVYRQVPVTQGFIEFPSLLISRRAYYNNTFITQQENVVGKIQGTFNYGNSKLIRYIGNIWERRSIEATV